MDNSNDWIVGDSEDENQPEIHLNLPKNGDVSSISQFTVDKIDANIPGPDTTKPSDISSFTISTKQTLPVDTTTDSISVTIPPNPVKPPRPRPRPAKRPVTPDMDVYEPFRSSIQSSNAETNNLNSSYNYTPTEINSSAKADDPFKLRKNNASESSSNDTNQLALQRKSMLIDVIDLLSDGEGAGPSLDHTGNIGPQADQNAQGSMQITREPTPPFFASTSGSSVVQISPHNINQQQTSIRPADTTKPAPAHAKGKRVSDKRTPPSSPVKVRKRRRKAIGIDDDFDFEDSVNERKDAVDVQNSFPPLSPARYADRKDSTSSRPEKTKKKEKSKEGKDKELAVRKKSSSKSKNDGTSSSTKLLKEQTFKSKEFIESDEDEDDLILKPSVLNASLSITSQQATVSVLPSVSASVKPSDGISMQSSLNVSMFPLRSDSPLSVETVPDLPADMSMEKVEKRVIPVKLTKKPKVDKPKKKAPVVGENSEKFIKEKKKTKSINDKVETGKAKEVNSVPPPIVKSSTSKKGEKVIESDQEEDDVDGTASLANGVSLPNDNVVENAKVASQSADLTGQEVAKVAVERPKAVIGNKENLKQSELNSKKTTTTAPPSSISKDKFSIKHSIPRRGSVTDLLRRVNSRPDSPLASPSPSTSTILMKSTRTALQRIAPLHPNRRTPPPPPPRPPPPKKTKKELQMEERLEEELAESVDGWTRMSSADRAALLKARIERELGYYD